MGIPRTGSRTIDIDGVRYRWRVRGKPTYAQASEGTPMLLAIERADSPMSRLVVTLDQLHTLSALTTEKRAVTPSRVRALVVRGLAEGWDPAAPGSMVELSEAPSDRPPAGRRMTGS